MTGDAVNDAAALKQADIGVAMGSGSEVTKQAARMILTDDNFGTLVHAVEIGRRVYDKVVSYVRYQMTQLLALVLLFLAATAFDINEGVALTPLMVLYLLFFVDRGRRRGHRRRPRRPRRHAPAAARPEAPDHQPRARSCSWLLYAAVALRRRASPARRRARRPEHRRSRASSMTMTFVVMGLGTVFNALTNRRDPASGLAAADPQGARDLARPGAPDRRSPPSCPASRGGCSPSRSPVAQWLACLGLAVLLPLVIEGRKWLRRRARRRTRRPWTSSARSRRAAREPDERARATARPVPRRTRSKRPASPSRDPASTGGPEFADLAQDELEQRAKDAIARGIAELSEAQELLWASDRYALLVVLQAMDAAGKDSVIKHVMSGVNPQGVQVVSFKQPSAEELDHDFLWRISKALPERGRIGIFNRSHYEEVVALKVHPEWLEPQRLPPGDRGEAFWQERYEDINAFERHLDRNGTKVVKFFLHVSKEVQKERFLARLDKPGKEWKFNAADVAERARFDDYISAFEDALTATSTPWAPWYVIPADHWWVTQALVAWVLVEKLRSLELRWPEVSAADHSANLEARKALEAEPSALRYSGLARA